MSSINNHPTFQYSQPEDYHFSHDSVFVARWLAENPDFQEKARMGARVLDLCSGTGIIGLDIAYHLCHEFGFHLSDLRIDFVDVQKECEFHFSINRQTLINNLNRTVNAPNESLNFHLANYEELLDAKVFKEQFEFIVCNPPYFKPDQGKLSPSSFKNRSRFYLDSNLQNLLLFISHALKPSGSAYILLRNLKDHGQDTLIEARSFLPKICNLNPIDQIRGTDLVEIRKMS